MSAMTSIEMNALANVSPQDKTAQGVDAPREFLTFCIGAEEYGIDILRVQEIRSYEAPTCITGAPRFVTGVTNLRGVIVPVVDLRLRLQADTRHDASTVIVVLNVHGRVVGVVVDSVSDVVEFNADPGQACPTLQRHGDCQPHRRPCLDRRRCG